MMFLPLQDSEQVDFDDCPSSPLGRKATQASNQDSYSTPKSKYKSVEKHAHQLINTPKPSSKKKSMFPQFENISDLPVFNDEIQTHPHPLNIHRQLSTIQENVDDDKENNQNLFNQYNSHIGVQEKHVKKLNLMDQTYQNDQINSDNTFGYQLNNIFQAMKNLPTSIHNSNQNNVCADLYPSNRLIDFFQMFNMKNEQIQNIFESTAQFEIINSGLSSSVAINIMQLNQTFNFLQIEQNSIEVLLQQESPLVINLRGIAYRYQLNPMSFLASAKINYNSNLISHIRIQFF